MKASELMVGDYITFSDVQNDSNCPKLKVIAINEEDVYGLNDGDPVADLYDIKELSGIPITPEILEKNGFENDFYEDVSVADYHSIRVEGYSLRGKVDGWDDFLITSCNGNIDIVTDFHGVFRGELRFVHQLQHAMRLCGIEKEIEL